MKFPTQYYELRMLINHNVITITRTDLAQATNSETIVPVIATSLCDFTFTTEHR